MMKLTSLLFFLMILLGVARALKLLNLRVPAHVPIGTRASMSCHWALDPGDVLYSVKWYKDGREFFRHVPRDVEPDKKFSLPGVDVEGFNSSGSNITLNPAVNLTSGRYRCEVSGEKPKFHTVSKHADLLVSALPIHGPNILGFKHKYSIGDHINVSCSSGHSRPANNLTWYINGEPAFSNMVGLPMYMDTEGLNTTRLELHFKITEDLVGDLKLKCVATLSSLNWKTAEAIATVTKKAIPDIVESDIKIAYSATSSVVTNMREKLYIFNFILVLSIINDYFLCLGIDDNRKVL